MSNMQSFRVSYLALWNLQPHDGVSRKMLDQIGAWSELGAKIQCVLLEGSDRDMLQSLSNTEVLLVPPRATLAGRILSDRRIKRAIRRFAPDAIYFRGFPCFLLSALKSVRVAKVAEVNSIEFNEHAIHALSLRDWRRYAAFLRNALRERWQRSVAGSVSGVVAVTNELAEHYRRRFGVKQTAVIPNAIRIKSWPPKRNRTPEDRPRLVFAGTQSGYKMDSHWHGLDKLLRFADRHRDALWLDVFGNYDSAEFGNVPPNVRFHGMKSRQELEDILETADVGIGTLALHRNGMNEACPLKTRQYLASGLPIVYAYTDPALQGLDCPDDLLQLPNTETNLEENDGALLEFCRRVAGRTVSSPAIREAIDSQFAEQRRLRFLQDATRQSESDT